MKNVERLAVRKRRLLQTFEIEKTPLVVHISLLGLGLIFIVMFFSYVRLRHGHQRVQ